MALCLHARPSRTPSLYIVKELCSGTPELRILPFIDGIITRYPRYSIINCRSLRCINVSLPSGMPTWVRRGTSLWHRWGEIVPEVDAANVHYMIRLKKHEVQDITNRLMLPIERGRGFRTYLHMTPTYQHVEDLTRDLVSAGYRGSILVSASIRCGQCHCAYSGFYPSHGPLGLYLIHLFLEFDMRKHLFLEFDIRKHAELCGAKAELWFKALSGKYIYCP